MPARRIVIIGSGVAGALVAQTLLAKDESCSIVMLEAGPPVPMRKKRVWADYITAKKDPYASVYDAVGDNLSQPSDLVMKGSRVIGRGGTTLHWGAWTPRFKPEDFALHTNAGREIDWPFSYDVLEPFYHRAELGLRVAGDSADDTPPRKGKAYALGPTPFAEADGPVIEALAALNMSYAHLPVARSERCITSGTCLYCPTGGKYSADLTLDELQRDRRFTLITDAPARRIIMRSKKSAAAVEYGKEGAVKTLEADVIVIAAGTVETPKLLLASNIGNETGHVGQHLKTHHVMRAVGVLKDNPKELRQELDFPTLCSRHLDTEKEQRDGKFFFVRTDTNPYDTSLPDAMTGGMDAKAIDARGKGPMRDVFYGHAEPFSDAGNYVGLGKGTTRFGIPVSAFNFAPPSANEEGNKKNIAHMENILRKMGANDISVTLDPIVRTAHIGGTARMSAKPQDGVVDGNLRVHGVDNLYLVSNAVMPNISAVNPTLTLAALALRLGEHISG